MDIKNENIEIIRLVYNKGDQIDPKVINADLIWGATTIVLDSKSERGGGRIRRFRRRGHPMFRIVIAMAMRHRLP